MTKESFTTTISGVDLDFHRFFNNLHQLQYVASYKSGTKDEVLLLLCLNDDNQWKFMFKEYVPQHLHHLENEIGDVIKRNEGV